MAEAVFNSLGLQGWLASSAGLSAKTIGNPVSEHAVTVLKQNGIDDFVEAKSAEKLGSLKDFEWILCMEEQQKKIIESMMSGSQLKQMDGKKKGIKVLGEFVSRPYDNPCVEIPNPFNKPLEEYQQCFKLIEDCVHNFASTLK